MMKILAYSICLPGHVYPMVPVLLELRRRGYEVLLALCSRGTGTTEVAGIPAREIHFDPDRFLDGGGAGDLRTLRDEAQRGYAARGEALAVGLERTLAEEEPDFILVDPAAWGGVIAASASGLPWATVAHSPMFLRGRGVDARGPGLRPPRGPLGRMWHRIVEAGLSRADMRYLSMVNAARTSRGLAPLAHPWDLFHEPPVILACTAEPFEYRRSDWPSSLRFVGPTAWEPSTQPPSWIDELDDRPLVLVATSSHPTQVDAREGRLLVDAVLRGLEDGPYQVVMTMPFGDPPGRVAENMRVERFVPHALLLPRAACVVCHGGAGITQKALAAGAPVVAVPWCLDRFELARRVEVAQAGVRLPRRRLTPARLRAAVDHAIRCRPGAERVAAAFREAGGAPAAADAVEDLLARWPSRPSLAESEAAL